MSSARNRLGGGKAIYIPSIQSILLIGGFHLLDGYQKHPWIYSLVTQKWREIEEISFKCIDFDAVLSSNQRYVLIFGGKKPTQGLMTEYNDSIFILDMKHVDQWKLKRCAILNPKESNRRCFPKKVKRDFIFRTGGIDSNDKKLVIGYIRDCFRQKEFENVQLPPMYLMRMIEKKFNTETFHWIQDGKRWCISLKDILNRLI